MNNEDLKYRHLSQRLGYSFKDKVLMEQALRHRSATGVSNERLEFLGDTILNFVMTEYLFQRFSQAPEGQLSRLRARLVCQETLANIARGLELGRFLELGPGERRNGGHQQESILADALEALMGAIYLDSSLAECQSVVMSWFQSTVSDLRDEDVQDSKTRLQEYVQSQRWPLPVYQMVELGKHTQGYTSLCRIPGLDLHVQVTAENRKKAEHEAARLLLERLKSSQ